MKILFAFLLAFLLLNFAAAQNGCGNVGGGTCTSDSDCTPEQGGTCTGTGDDDQLVCECPDDRVGEFCQTERQSQLKAWLFSWFLGWCAADRFYLGWAGLGAAKLILIWAWIPLAFVMIPGCVCAGTDLKALGVVWIVAIALLMVLCYIGGSVWWFVDWLLLLIPSSYCSENGNDLERFT